jgi:hypothetical protein
VFQPDFKRTSIEIREADKYLTGKLEDYYNLYSRYQALDGLFADNNLRNQLDSLGKMYHLHFCIGICSCLKRNKGLPL